MPRVFHFFVLVIPYVWGSLHPIILVPGDGGSQMDAMLDKPSVVHYICTKKTTDFFNIWLNMELLVPLVIDCWIDNVSLVYDNVTRTTSNPPGVTTRIPGFGGTETVEWIDPSHASSGTYFKYVADVLVTYGHTRNVTVKGAPYDFRKAPNENQEFFVEFKKLIEATVKENGGQPAILVAHSMGGPMCTYFLSKQTQKWKDENVRSLVTLAGVWGGAVKAVKVYLIGDDLGAYMLRGTVMRREQITSPSLAWLLPNKNYWKENEVLVETELKNYTLANLQELFNDISYPNGWEMKKDTELYQPDLTPPGVEVHCLYGGNVQTVERLYYKPGTGLDDTPQLIYGDGDGTVNRRSLEGCLKWAKLQKQPVHQLRLPNVDHMAILKDQNVLNYIANLVNYI